MFFQQCCCLFYPIPPTPLVSAKFFTIITIHEKSQRFVASKYNGSQVTILMALVKVKVKRETFLTKLTKAGSSGILPVAYPTIPYFFVFYRA